MTRFVLHRAQRALRDRKSANDVELKQFGMSMLLLLTEVCVPRTARLCLHSASRQLARSFAQDLPFFVLSTILLIRTVNRKDDAAVLAPNRFCSAEYDTRSFILLFLNTMKTAGMLATKLVKLKSLPSIWSKKLKLQVEQGKLAQRVARLESVEMAALAAAAPAEDDASAELPQDAAPADGGSAQTPEHRCTVAACPASDAGSSSTASLPLVSLSVRFTESAFGEEGSRASVACACAEIMCARPIMPLCRNRPRPRSAPPSEGSVDLRHHHDCMDDVQGAR